MGSLVASRSNPCEGHHYFPRNPNGSYISIARGEGVYMYDEMGRALLDGASGAAVVCLGHGNKRIAAKMAEQASQLAFAHGSQFVSSPVLELADRLAKLAGDSGSRVYFASGGSEANETALKIVMAYQLAMGSPEKQRVVSRSVSYHGATLGALAMTGNLHRRELYESLLTSFPRTSTCYCYRCPFDLDPTRCAVECADDVERTIIETGSANVAAFIIEPVIGASAPGVEPIPEYMKMIVDICRRHGVLLIADEVMSGVGRTGRFLATEHYGIQPDITVLSKALSSGYSPLAAVIVSGRVFEAIRRAGPGHLVHGFTFSGNPLSAATGLEVLDILHEEQLIERAERSGRILMDRLQPLRALPMVGEIRGRGLLLGIEFVADRQTRKPFSRDLGIAWRVQRAALDQGLWIYGGTGSDKGIAGDHILIAPPYIITESQIDELVEHLTAALNTVQREFLP